MAKRSKTVEPIIERYSKEDSSLIASTGFVYEVDIFISTCKSYHLEDSKLVKTKELRSDKMIVYNKIKGSFVIQRYNLIAAPKQWLMNNKYTFIN